MTDIVMLGGSANAPCLNCGMFVAFFSGRKEAFISDVKKVASDSVLKLACKIHGAFDVRAGEFRDRLD